MWRTSWAAVLAAALGLTFADASGADEQGTAVGRIVAARGDETLQPAGAAGARPLQVGQSVAAGDVLKTGPYGSAAILLRDDTQIRIHRQSTFEIGQVRGAAGELSKFRLLTGSAWSRAKALLRAVTGEMGIGRQAIEMATPTATIGIRGTDWYVSVGEDGRTDVIVLAGEVDLANELGAIQVASGEQGTVERGKPPTKRTVVDLRNRPLIVMETELEWFDMLTVGGRRTVELKWAREELEQTVAAGAQASSLVALAGVAYDQGDYAAAAAALERAAGANPDATDQARAQLVKGLLDVRRRDLGAAGRELDGAAANLTGREQVIAGLGSAGVDVEQRRYAAAEAKVQRHAGESARYPEVRLFQAWLASFAGRHEEAMRIARDGEAAFAYDPRFPALYAYLAFLLGQPDEMKAGIDRALAIDPDMPFAWYVKGLYHHYAEPDAAAARAAYAHAVKVNPNHTASWNNLALVDLDRGDYKATQAAMQEALRSDPRSPITRSNYGFILAFLDRLDDAEAEFREAARLDPSQPYSQVGLGFLDLFRGDPDSAAGEFLAAGAIDPELPGVNRNLAAAYYQTGRFEDANTELDNARRFDPDDPIPDVMGSIMAVDQYEAGEAIRYAREGFQKTLRAE
ncbi:MAG: tetratricopeptide repeat protein, partial [Gammaproteobacteria bacterium]|nr:tetratricopeptide repeat protein [Gammaproteobacteria bacterium]